MRSRVVGAMVAAAILIGGYAVVGGGGGGGSSFSGPFNCYGVDASGSCYSLAACTGGAATVSTGAQLQTELASATAGTVVCLNAGNYGTVTVTNMSNASDVIIQPVTVATAATIADLVLDWSSHYLVQGVTLTELAINASSNITVQHVTEGQGYYEACQSVDSTTGRMCCWDPPNQTCTINHRVSNAAIRFDYISAIFPLDSLHPGSSTFEGRITAIGDPNASTYGVTVAHSLFQNGCADGVDDDAVGTTVGPGNEFTLLVQNQTPTDCSTQGVHVDPVQSYVSTNLTVTGNYFHANADGDGGLGGESGAVSTDAGHVSPPSLVFSNNVIVDTIGHLWTTGFEGATLSHNTFVGGSWIIGWSHCGGTAVDSDHQVANNNILDAPGVQDESSGEGCGTHTPSGAYSSDHNLGTLVGTNNSTSSPIFVTSPASGYYHYELASNSPGYHGGSDGKSIGIAP